MTASSKFQRWSGCSLSCTTEKLLDVEAPISEVDVGFKGERADAVEDTLDRVGGGFVAANLRESKRETLSGRECEGSTVSVACRGSIGWFHRAEFAFLVVVGAVIRVIDEIKEDGPRPREVEDLRGLIGEEFVSGRFEIVLVNRMEPISDSIVAGSIVRLGTDFPDGRLTNSSTSDDGPDITGIEGRTLDPWLRKITDLVLG